MPVPNIFEPLIDKEELARRLSVSLSCIDQWLRTKRIPCYCFGRHCVRFDYSQVRLSLAKFEKPALLRFPRQVYRPRKKKLIGELEQLPLPLTSLDPDQFCFDFFNSEPERLEIK